MLIYRLSTWSPPDVIGACLAYLGKFLLIPDLPKPIAIAGAIIKSDYFFEYLLMGMLYFI